VLQNLCVIIESILILWSKNTETIRVELNIFCQGIEKSRFLDRSLIMPDSTSQHNYENTSVAENGGKYLTFALAHEEYGLEILKVREIIGYMEITAVPQMPHFVEGVINLRGQIIPVIGLRTQFGMERAEVNEQTCIIVVEVIRDMSKYSYGVMVDRVLEVIEIPGENIEKTPQFGSPVNTDVLLGIGKVGESIKILLDIDKVLERGKFSTVVENCAVESVTDEK